MTPTPFVDTAPAWDGAAVTPSTAPLSPRPRALWVGTAGDLVIETNGAAVTLAIAAPGFVPVSPSRVLPATTAADLVAVY